MPSFDRRRPGEWLATVILCGLLAWAAGRALGPTIACESTRGVGVASAAARPAEGTPGRRGLDLQVRVGRLRIEFPWMRTLPIAPGRRIVISIEPWGAGPD